MSLRDNNLEEEGRKLEEAMERVRPIKEAFGVGGTYDQALATGAKTFLKTSFIVAVSPITLSVKVGQGLSKLVSKVTGTNSEPTEYKADEPSGP